MEVVDFQRHTSCRKGGPMLWVRHGRQPCLFSDREAVRMRCWWSWRTQLLWKNWRRTGLVRRDLQTRQLPDELHRRRWGAWSPRCGRLITENKLRSLPYFEWCWSGVFRCSRSSNCAGSRMKTWTVTIPQ